MTTKQLRENTERHLRDIDLSDDCLATAPVRQAPMAKINRADYAKPHRTAPETGCARKQM